MPKSESSDERVSVLQRGKDIFTDKEVRRKAASLLAIGSLGVFSYVGAGYANDKVNAKKSEQEIATMNVCDYLIETWDGIDKVAAAERCLEKRTGKVAMVAFGEFADEDLERVGNEAEKLLSNGTAGLVDVDIVMLRPADEVAEELMTRNPKTLKSGERCLDTDSVSAMPARVADEMMDLDDYSVVVGVSDMYSCRPLGGMAYSNYGWRYANTYRGAGEVEGIADTVAHEVAHTMGLGHGDRVSNLEINSDFALLKVMDGNGVRSMNRLIRNSERGIDITAALDGFNRKNYIGYGGVSDLMGDITEVLEPKGMSVWKLNWPERALGQAEDIKKVINGRRDVLLKEAGQYEVEDFAVLELEDPIVLDITSREDAEKGITEHKTYNMLAIDTLFSGPTSQAALLHVYLIHEGYGNSLSLGVISLDMESEAEEALHIGSQTLLLKGIFGQGVAIRDMSGSDYSPAITDNVSKRTKAASK